MRGRAYLTMLGAGLLGIALSSPTAEAGTILVFGQNGISNEFTAANDGSTGALGGTTLSAVNIEVTITGIDNASPLPGSFPAAFLNLSATSVSNATVNGAGQITQDFTGSFSITSLAGGGGSDYLSGSFHDAVFGEGTGLTMTASGSGVPTFMSDVIDNLSQTRAMSLSFTDVTPSAFVTSEMTLSAFTSNVSGGFSAAPEPSSFVILGIGIAGVLTLIGRSKRSRARLRK